jgi:hypothetical protein
MVRGFEAAASPTCRHRPAELIGVSQLAELCAIPILLGTDMTRRAQSQGYCPDDYPGEGDGQACITTPANIFYHAIHSTAAA